MSAESADGTDRSREFADIDLTHQVIGVFFDVYAELGFGFLESVYREAMSAALRDAGLAVAREAPVLVTFRGQLIAGFRLDLVVEDRLVLELKSVTHSVDAHRNQLVNYLRTTKYELGLLLNFGLRPQVRRVAFSNSRKSSREGRGTSD